MFGLGYLDCKLMALGTRLFVAKEKLISEFKYASINTPERIDKIKSKAEYIKKEKEEKKKQKEAKDVDYKEVKPETETSETVKEEPKGSEQVKEEPEPEVASSAVNETISNATEPKVETANQNQVDPDEPTILGPDFSLFNGVTYDPYIGNFVVTETDDEEEQVTDEEAKNLLKQMQASQVSEQQHKIDTVEEVTDKLNQQKPLKPVTQEDLNEALVKAEPETSESSQPTETKVNPQAQTTEKSKGKKK